MIQNHIWRSEANPSQDHAGCAVQLIPEHVTIVVAQRTSSGIASCASEMIPTSVAQRLCRELLESSNQLASVSDVQCIIENHGVALTNTAVRKFRELDGAIFYDKDILLEEYVVFAQLIESEFGEMNSLCLEFIETNSPQLFVICACY